ncbi:MAG: hypothetical protein WCK57_02210 [Verrucomicrobiae bacterium]
MKALNTSLKMFWSRQITRLLSGLVWLTLTATAQAQIDPAPRQILQVGANASLHDQGPLGAYLFYYWNMPNITTNVFLRLAIAPVYVDSETGFKSLIAKNTDLAVGAFGGLYGNSYQEVRGGHYYKGQSFDGNGGGGSLSIYHLFNPNDRIPLSGILRGSVNYHSFDTTDNTAKNFILPDDQPFITYRAGLRWGGKEPYLAPTLGMEISAWYELEQRTQSGSYGFSNDRRLEAVSQRLFARAQINYTTLESQHYIVLGLQGGAAFNSDRFSCYRIGGVLPYTKEFPLTIPGYFDGELSAQDFGLLYGTYTIPFGSQKAWSLIESAAAAVVQYQDGMGQAGAFNSGVGTGIGYTRPSRRWKVMSLLGYGIQAERSNGRGGWTLGMAFQYNFGSTDYAGHKAWEELEESHSITR